MTQHELREVYKGENATIDIVFIHGLRGSIEGTWIKSGILWPQSLLKHDIEDSRIFLFGYDSGITHWDQASVAKTQLEYDAEDLAAKLGAQRSETDTVKRPLIFVAHSLGGLVCAELVVEGARKAVGDNAQMVAQYTRGMVFLGTPFRGSKNAKPGEYVRKILSVLGVSTQEKTLKLLGVNSERLEVLTTSFQDIIRKRISSKKPVDQIHAFFFYETLPTGLNVIVERDSACLPGCGDSAPVRANHLDMCKFATPKDDGYGNIVAAIRKVKAEGEVVKPTERSNNMYNFGKAVNMTNESMRIHTQNVTL